MDNNELGTNLAELGTDCISRLAAIDAIYKRIHQIGYENDPLVLSIRQVIRELPPAQPEIKQQAINSSDCIDRQAAIDIAKELTITLDGYEMSNQAVMNYCAEIMQLPPIQPKRGRWHYSDGKPARIGMSFGVICDQCGTESEYCTNFCGECGADMRGEQNG